MVAVAYEGWSLTRGFNYSDLTWKLLVFRKTGRWGDVVATGASTVTETYQPRFKGLSSYRSLERARRASTIRPQWTNLSWQWNQIIDLCVINRLIDWRGPVHKHIRKDQEANLSQIFRSARVSRSSKYTYVEWNLLSFMEVLLLMRFETFPFEERAICGVISDQRSMKWSAFPFFWKDKQQFLITSLNGVRMASKSV